MENILRVSLIMLLVILLGVSSCLMLGSRFSQPESYSRTIASIDGRINTVLKLSATSAVASAGISMIPDDTATPIAAKLADFTEYFMLILCVLYTEKYLLTILGAAAFRFLIPAACAAVLAGFFWNPKGMRKISAKLVLFSIAIVLVIPAGSYVSDMIYNTYRDSIGDTIYAAEELALFSSSEADSEEASGATGALGRLWNSAGDLTRKAGEIVNRYVESLAVMIVTSCVIPVLVLLFFIWLIKLFTGVNLSEITKRAAV